MSTWNKKNFSIYTSDEKTVLGLLDELGSQVNHNTDNLKNKTDLYGDHKGSWQGLSRPTLSEEGMRATVEDIIDNKIPSIQSSLEQITIQINKNDNIQQKINYAIEKGFNVYSVDVLEIQNTLTLDFKNKSNLKIELKIKPSISLNDCIIAKNGNNININLSFIGGGNSISRGLIIENLNTSKISLYGDSFEGTLLCNNGYVEDNNKNRFCDIILNSINCGRAFYIGDENKTINAFGKFSYIFDSSRNGSVLINVCDLTIDSIENAFFQLGKTYLTIDRCYSIYFGNCALGGVCDFMLDIKKSFIHFSKLLLINDKKDGVDSSNMNGIKITSDSISSTGSTSMVSIGTLDAYNLNKIVMIDDKTNFNAFIRPHANNNIVLTINDVDEKLPNYMPSHFDTRTKRYIGDNSEIYYKEDGLQKGILSTIKDIIKKVNALINRNLIENSVVATTAGTSLTHTINITYPTERKNIPNVVACTNGNFIACPQNITSTSCNIVLYKPNGSNFNNESITVRTLISGN